MGDSNIQEAMRRAVGMHQAGQLEEAAKAYSKIIATAPDYPEALNLHGVVCGQLGRKGEAVSSLKLAAKLVPDNPAYQQNLGKLLIELGDLENAEQALRLAIYLAPNMPQAHANLGNLYKQQKKFQQAIGCYQKALEFAPTDYKSWNNLGNTWRELKEYEKAEECLRKAHRIKPDFVEAMSNLGMVLGDREHPQEALVLFEQALKLDPASADLHLNYGNTLRELGRENDASAAYAEAAVKLDPKHGGAWSALGNSALALGNTEYAGECYRRAVELSPEDPAIHFNLALYLLLTGNLKEGFAEYEWGLRGDMRQPRRPFRQPRWRGEAFKDEALLVYSEQGLGDTFQFIRFLPEVKARGGRVILELQQGLTPLLKDITGVDQIIERQNDGAIPVGFDKYVALLSLPTLLDVTLDNCTPTIPYICPSDTLLAKARERLQDDTGFKIAFTWYGNPAHKNDRNRSCPLEKLAPLINMPGVSAYALSPGERTQSDIADSGLPIKSLSVTLPEAAALMHEMDLLVSVDTSHVHMMGAMGRPVWVMLPFSPDWRWLQNRDDTPWYPGARLFRQPRPRTWEAVVEQMHAALAAQLDDPQRKTAE
ncbi:MAG: tetratricopeptide repeat protein [Gammaproteobacteria bacterium]